MHRQDAIRSILDSLRRLVRELRIFSRRAQATTGLTAAQLFVLERVAANQPVSVNALAELTLTHQSSVSVVAQNLVERGLLQQRRALLDRRQKELTITALGKRALQRAPGSVQDRLIAAASAMNAQDQQSLERLLRTLTQAIGLTDSAPVLFFEKERASKKAAIRRNPPAPSRKRKGSR